MQDQKFNIGVIGSGNIGGTLGKHFAKAGYPVMFSSRHPEQLTALAEEAGHGAQVGTIEAAAGFGEVILLSIPFGKTPDLKEQVGTLEGKVLIDTNNYYPQRDGDLPGNEMAQQNLLESEWTASHFPSASVAKAFNTIYYITLGGRAFDHENPMAIPFGASDEKAKEITNTLIHDIGFAPVHVGDLRGTKSMQPGQKLYTKELAPGELQKLL